jgi:aminotransferase
MDTSDPEIVFDEQGVCNHCHDYDRLMTQKVHRRGGGQGYIWSVWSKK